MVGKSDVGHILDATIPPQEHMTTATDDRIDIELYFHTFTFNERKLILVREQPITDKWINSIRSYLKKQFPIREE